MKRMFRSHVDPATLADVHVPALIAALTSALRRVRARQLAGKLPPTARERVGMFVTWLSQDGLAWIGHGVLFSLLDPRFWYEPGVPARMGADVITLACREAVMGVETEMEDPLKEARESLKRLAVCAAQAELCVVTVESSLIPEAVRVLAAKPVVSPPPAV